MNKRTLFSACLCLVVAAMLGYASYQAAAAPHNHPRWVVYYSDKLPFSHFKRYDVIALDSDHYPAFKEEKREGQVVLGYLSTSEAEEYRSYYPDIAKLDVLIQPSDLWEAHMVIDIRKQQWQDYFVHTLVPAVLAKGFDGIMLDTLDTTLYLEESHPQEFKGMAEAAVRLIHAIRKAHPDIKLMLNRGFPVLDKVAGDIDYLLAESIRVEHDFDKHTSRYFAEEIYGEYVAKLEEARRINPNLQVVTLDYWDMSPKGEAEVRNIYAEQRANGFIPYVTTVDLAQHHKEPE